MNVGKNIARLRKKVGITQEKLAELCGISRQAVTKWEAEESEPSIEKIEILSDIFQVRTDEIIKGESSASLVKKEDEKQQKKKYYLYEQCIHDINRLYDVEAFREQGIIYYHLMELYSTVKCKYVSENGETLEKYLVANTTKEDREVVVSSIRGPIFQPFQSFIEYCEGKIEIAQAFDEVIADLKKAGESDRDNAKNKRNTKQGKLFIKIDITLMADSDWDDYSDKKMDAKRDDLLELINDIQPDSVAERTLLIYATELLHAIENRDEAAKEKLTDEWRIIHTAIWKLI